MTIASRRSFLALSAAAIPSAAAAELSFEAVAFDGFAIFDPRPVFSFITELFPERGKDLVSAWRGRQFEYTWLRTLTDTYVDFRQVTEDALVFAAGSLGIDLTSDLRGRIMQRYVAMTCWPETPQVLRSLKNAGLRLVLLSNMTEDMMESGIGNSGIAGAFDHLLSTDRVKSYKPSPRAYAMGAEALRLPKRRILFAAFAGWDASGAKTFGYPVYWVNRAAQPAEQLGERPDGEGSTLRDLAAWIAGDRRL